MDSLRVTHGSDSPSGDNLEYDADFMALALAAQPGQERQAGKDIIAAEEPDHKAVVEGAKALLLRSHDLRIAMFWAVSALRLTGFAGFAEATGYMRFCLEEHWETCHPQLDADDDNDPTMRINAMVALSDTETTLKALRMVPLADSMTFGRVTLRDILIAEGEIAVPADMAKAPDAASLNAAFKDTKPAALKERLDAVRVCLDNAQGINRVFDQRTPGIGPNLDGLLKMLRRILSRLALEVGEPEVPVTEEAQTAADAPGPVAAVAGGVPGHIGSRADVLAALERILAYYSRYEPSSPLPLLLMRAQRLVGADFLTIMRDLAPMGVENVNMIGGIEES